MVERLRIFQGANELTHRDSKIVLSHDRIVDQGTFTIEKNNNVTPSSIIDFKKVDGTTTIFTGRINEIEKDELWRVKVFGRGYELMNINVLKVYENTSPEDIVKDVVDTFSENLTYASTETSGFTIKKYIAKGYLIDAIRDMQRVLRWQIRIDSSDNFYFEPAGNVTNGKVFTNGTDIDFKVEKWEDDKTEMINKLKLKGGNASFNFTDSDTGTGSQTVFTLTHKPKGDVVVTVSGSVKTGGVDGSGDYEYDPEERKVTFTVAPAASAPITFDYAYNLPVVVQDQNDQSITDHGTVFKELILPGIDTFADARRIVSKVLEQKSTPLLKAKGTALGLDFSRSVNELVTVRDNVRTKTDNTNYNESMVINKLIWDGGKGVTKYEFGEPDFLVYNWQSEVQDRIRQLEDQAFNEADLAESRIFKHDLNVTLWTTLQPKLIYPRDTTLLSHRSLGRYRFDRTFEPDCASDFTRGHVGRWFGTDVTTGGQYNFVDVFSDLLVHFPFDERDGTTVTDTRRRKTGTTSGTPTWKDGQHGSAIDFDGTDDYVDFTDDTAYEFGSSDFVLEAWIYLDTVPTTDEDYTILSKWNETGNQREFKWHVANADDKVKFVTSSDGTAETTVSSNTKLEVNTWYHVMLVKGSTTATFYLNGASDGSGTVDGTLNTGTAKMYAAATEGESTSPDSLLDGRIDNVRIFSGGTLTAQQVSELHDLTGRENFKGVHGSFNGTDRYVEVVDAAALRLTGDFSIALSVKVDSLPGAEKYLVHKWDGTDGYAVRIASDNKVELIYANGGATETIKASTALTAGVFQHVVFTKEGTSLIVYVNGSSDNTATAGSATVGTVTDNLQIGRYTTNYFSGYIDEVRLYSDDLAAAEVTALNAKKDLQTDLVAYWAFDDGRLGDRFTRKREVST